MPGPQGLRIGGCPETPKGFKACPDLKVSGLGGALRPPLSQEPDPKTQKSKAVHEVQFIQVTAKVQFIQVTAKVQFIQVLPTAVGCMPEGSTAAAPQHKLPPS